MTKIIMHGCNGSMGQVITSFIAVDDEIEIVAGIDAYDGIPNSYPVYKSLEDCKEEADAIIDFATASAVDGLLDYCSKKKVPVVLCTTGLTKEQLSKVEECSKKVAILKSANMSLGVNMLFKLLKEATAILAPADFDIEIIEKHHNQKVDAPSGTALALADAINEELNNEYSYNFDRSQDKEKRKKKEIGFAAVRGGTIVGEHDVIFAGADEVITFSHQAYSKSVFGKGAIQAAKYLKGKPAGLYDMSCVIDGK